MTRVEFATCWMESLANDNSHGYSQANRWGPDYDCSSAVIQAWENAGVPVKSRGATYTGNMYDIFIVLGFEDITSRVNLLNGSGMIRGDVLLNHANHTAMVTTPGTIVHARSSEGNSMPGDQSGNEIRIQSYWNYPWNAVLRYPDDELMPEMVDEEPEAATDPTLFDKIKDFFKPSAEKTEEAKTEIRTPVHYTSVTQMPGYFPLLTVALQNEKREDVRAFQTLYNLRFEPTIEVDGYYGSGTKKACELVQRTYKLFEDGECGKDTWTALINGK